MSNGCFGPDPELISCAVTDVAVNSRNNAKSSGFMRDHSARLTAGRNRPAPIRRIAGVTPRIGLTPAATERLETDRNDTTDVGAGSADSSSRRRMCARDCMISLKRYLDKNSDASLRALLAAVIAAYQSALKATGESAAQASPSVDPDLRRKLTGFGLQLANVEDAAVVTGTEVLVTQELQRWGEAAAADLQQKAKDVKELLVVLADAAATIAASDETHAGRFQAFTSRLERIADLDDIRMLRSSLMRSAAELRTCVQQMSANSRASVSKLQAEVGTYRTRLEAAEQTAARDTLTNLFNRGRVESHIDTRIAMGRAFSLALIDLDGFKAVNDRLGHAVGDDLLKQFSTDLLANARPTDLVGRWGGDEFILILDCGRKDAQAHIERIEKWVVGDYTIDTGGKVEKVRLDASIGVSEWSPGMTRRDLLEMADMAMYSQKRRRR